jgi:hypothetical protein
MRIDMFMLEISAKLAAEAWGLLDAGGADCAYVTGFLACEYSVEAVWRHRSP